MRIAWVSSLVYVAVADQLGRWGSESTLKANSIVFESTSMLMISVYALAKRYCLIIRPCSCFLNPSTA